MSRNKKKELNRTGKLTCPFCSENHILVEHHICGRKIPDYNAASNKVNCCSNCHREIHEGLIIIEGWFMTTSGLELLWHRKGEESITGCDAKTHIIGHNSKYRTPAK